MINNNHQLIKIIDRTPLVLVPSYFSYFRVLGQIFKLILPFFGIFSFLRSRTPICIKSPIRRYFLILTISNILTHFSNRFVFLLLWGRELPYGSISTQVYNSVQSSHKGTPKVQFLRYLKISFKRIFKSNPQSNLLISSKKYLKSPLLKSFKNY